jgi:predicted AAA+ superfamily ATPase
VVQRGGSAALFGVSIDWLSQAGVVMKCQRIEQALNPIAVYADLSSFKLYMGDVGLLAMKSGIAQQTVLSGESNNFMGAMTENYIAQALTARGYPLFYWTSDYSAELDFVMQKGTDIIGIEVKKGIKTHSKSLNQFIQQYKPAWSIRFSEKNFGQTDTVLAVPHYAAFCV